MQAACISYQCCSFIMLGPHDWLISPVLPTLAAAPASQHARRHAGRQGMTALAQLHMLCTESTFTFHGAFQSDRLKVLRNSSKSVYERDVHADNAQPKSNTLHRQYSCPQCFGAHILVVQAQIAWYPAFSCLQSSRQTDARQEVC